MKKLIIGIVAHVDAGKTTLSESILYLSGKIRKLGRVDNQDAYLDTDALEKARGITIFSKQAIFQVGDTQITLLDTPGHVDFSAEMERTLQVLDYAILVISGKDGLQGHTKTVWQLLSVHKIPVFLFINKMDQKGVEKEKLLKDLKLRFSDGCIDFGQGETTHFFDQLAMCDETFMETYLETETLEVFQIAKMIKERKVFPCFFGSALKVEGVEAFLRGIVRYSSIPNYPEPFGAKVFKITRDAQGNRLTHMKITGGRLKVRNALSNTVWEEKISQIRIYSGQKFEAVSEVEAGSLCAVTGLSQTRPGEGFGIESDSAVALLEPVLSYQILLPEDCDPKMMLPKLRQIEEEQPELHVIWEERLQELQIQMMGEVQIEILKKLIEKRFGVHVSFDSGRIVYKETIRNMVEGVGHFEPLRHYAEVHLLLEPGLKGSGLQFQVACSEELLEKNWQRLILSHLEEKSHKGVLTGSVITDMKITVVGGRAHKNHTEGGDFREATYRAVRQGLKEAESLLLEPYYLYQLELPKEMVGRGMRDVDKMHGTCEIAQTNDETVILTGSAPMITMRNYQQEVISYTKGYGRLSCRLKGYEACHNWEEVLEHVGYDSERDVVNPAGSVFCANGTGFLVKWDEVKAYMHVESYLEKEREQRWEEGKATRAEAVEAQSLSLEEIEQIINNTSFANQGEKSAWKKRKTGDRGYHAPIHYTSSQKKKKESYLLVDGYNIIFAWPALKAVFDVSMEGARIKLIDTLSKYQYLGNYKIVVVFDAYRVQGHRTEGVKYDNILVVYTKEGQTADHYIEKFVHDHHEQYHVTVATSDGLEQMMVRGKGGMVLSARELQEEIERSNERLMEEYEGKRTTVSSTVMDAIPLDTKKKLEEIL